MSEQGTTKEKSMKLAPMSEKVNLADWNLRTFQELQGALEKKMLEAIQEILQLALESKDTEATWPVIWGDGDGRNGPAPKDPLTVYLRIALGPEFEGPEFTFNLRDDLRQWLREREGRPQDYDAELRRVRDALRELAQEIDDEIQA